MECADRVACGRGRTGERSGGQGSCRPVKDFAFYMGFKGKSVQSFEGWSDTFSHNMHFCNIRLLCNYEHVLLL